MVAPGVPVGMSILTLKDVSTSDVELGLSLGPEQASKEVSRPGQDDS